MTVDANKALVRRFYDEVWRRGNLDVCDEVFADGYVRHDLRAGDPEPGPEGQKRVARLFRAAFPDLAWEVDFLLGEEDFVAGRWTASGTRLGSWAGIAPTGRQMRFAGINVFRFEDGKVAEIWNHRDDLGLMEQLGAPVYAGSPR